MPCGVAGDANLYAITTKDDPVEGVSVAEAVIHLPPSGGSVAASAEPVSTIPFFMELLQLNGAGVCGAGLDGSGYNPNTEGFFAATDPTTGSVLIRFEYDMFTVPAGQEVSLLIWATCD